LLADAAAPLPLAAADRKPPPSAPATPASQPALADPASGTGETAPARLALAMPAPAAASQARPPGSAASSPPASGAAADGAAAVLPVITDPRFRQTPNPPVYPSRARQLGQQGEALIRARVDLAGNPAEVILWRSSGFALLDRAALAAVRQWQFEPARRDGQPIAAWVEVPIRFSLQ